MSENEQARKITEKRKHERKATRVPVEVVSRGQIHKETAGNVSFSGIYIKNADVEKYDLNQEIVLAFESKDGKPYTAEGIIVRKDENGAGIQFKTELVTIALQHAAEWGDTD